MRLSDGIIGRSYIVTDITLPLDLTRRLEVLGLTHDVQLSVLNRKRRGALMIQFRNTRFAVGRSVADGITIKEEL